ncbi:MAG: aldo/keto reductase [Microbacteriaceae bacterium]
MTTVPRIQLSDGTSIPQLGLGTYKLDDDSVVPVIHEALEIGYRHIDTAKIYRNETGVGRAIATSGIARDDLYVTTKLWNDDHLQARSAIEASLERLGLDHVDLYLVHWPFHSAGTAARAWEQMVEIREAGLATSIGVSNFLPEHLDAIAAVSDVVPVINQIEVHPLLQQAELRAECAARGIRVESWGPLGHGSVSLAEELPQLAAIADAHGKSVPQVVLRWHIEEGLIIFPKTAHSARLRENFDIFDFALSSDEMDAIRALNQDRRVGVHPHEGNWS